MTLAPRALLAALYDAAVAGAAPAATTQHAVARWLAAEGGESARPIRLFAMGKAASAMTRGALDALRDARRDPVGGVIVCGSPPSAEDLAPFPPSLAVHVGDHPIPGPNSLNAGDAISAAVHEVQAGDVALVLISGGTTSLAAAPVAALSQAIGDVDRAQAHIANLADTLLESGLAIHEMNAIRRRVLRWGAGRLAEALDVRGVVAIPLFAISDVIGDDPSVIGSGPCSPDVSDDATFLALLDAHHVRDALEHDMARFLGLVGHGATPRVPEATHPAFAKVRYTIVARNANAVHALASAAAEHGVTNVHVVPEPMIGNAAALGHELALQALNLAMTTDRHDSALVVLGGEPVVHLRETYHRAMDIEDDEELPPSSFDDDDVTGSDASRAEASRRERDDEPMSGGRMQVLALAAALALETAAERGDRHARRITILAAGTDGRDGPTDAAGAIVDALVPGLARRAARHPERDLRTGRSWFPLDAAHALLRPGPTGTNVMDVAALLVSADR